MTRSDVFIQVLTEIAAAHREEVREILEVFEATIPGLNKFDKELPDEEAAQLLEDFRKDQDAIRIWLLQGRNQFVARAKKSHESAPLKRNIK